MTFKLFRMEYNVYSSPSDVRSTTKRVVVRGKRKATEKETRIYQMKIEMLTNID